MSGNNFGECFVEVGWSSWEWIFNSNANKTWKIVKTKTRGKAQYKVIYTNPAAPRNFVEKHPFKLVDCFLVNTRQKITKNA